MAGKRKRRLRRCRTGHAQGHAAGVHMRCNRVAQRRFAAEQMLAPLDVDADGVGCVRHYMRGKGDARMGQQVEPVPIRCIVCLNRNQIGNAGPRIGKRHAGGKTQILSACIYCRQPQRVLRLGDKDDRRRLGGFRLRVGRSEQGWFLLPQTVCGQVRKPECQLSPRR